MSATTPPTEARRGPDSGGSEEDGLSTPEGGSPQRELPVLAGGSGGGKGAAALSDFDVETLDESEFDLPPVATPTLQSILDELQNDVDEFEIGERSFMRFVLDISLSFSLCFDFLVSVVVVVDVSKPCLVSPLPHPALCFFPLTTFCFPVIFLQSGSSSFSSISSSQFPFSSLSSPPGFPPLRSSR